MFYVKKFSKVELAANEEVFLDVISDISYLRHPHIATLKGYCVDQGQLILVYDYAINGSLDDFLFSDTQKILSWEDRVMIARGVAHALQYMHWTRCPPIAHGNIKATNILLDDKLIPHIGDCDLTMLKHLIRSKPEAPELPINCTGYAAPEQGIPGKYETENDVFSFGVVLLHLFTRKRDFGRGFMLPDSPFCYHRSSRSTLQEQVEWAFSHLHSLPSLEVMVDPAIKDTIPPKELSQFADIISTCVQQVPVFRAEMCGITENLSSLAKKMGIGQMLGSSSDASEFNVLDPISETTTDEPSFPA